MKISLIYDFLSEFGGLERVIVNHARMLQEAGYEVEVLSCYVDPEVIKKMDFGDIPVKSVSKIETKSELVNLSLCFFGLNTIKHVKTDAFLSYSFPSNFLIRKRKEKKMDYMNHFPHFIYLNKKERLEWASSTKGFKRKAITLFSFIFEKPLKSLDKRLLKKNGLVFVNSDFTKKRLEKIYGMKFIVNYPPLGPDFKPSKKRIQKKFILSSSRIIPDKKYDWLIESCSHMKNKVPLYISGQTNDAYKEQLLNIAKKNKVEIKFLGRLSTEDLISHYSSALAVAFPAPGEDFGLVPAEALACGSPVVVWGDGAGPTEQVIDNVNGFHAKPYEKKDFAKKLDLIIDNKFKIKNQKKILLSSKKFSYPEIKKNFILHINKFLKK